MSGGPLHGSPYGPLGGLANNALAAAQGMQNQSHAGWLVQQHQQALMYQAALQGAMALVPPTPAKRWLKPDPKQPDTLGWREWVWSETVGCLISPSQNTPWHSAHLTAEAWAEADAVRGAAGIHAHLVPRHWKIIGQFHEEYATGESRVSGIVERFGKYVLGTEGWRAEQAVIRELMAPSTEIGLKLEALYPDVIVHYPDQTEEGETPWKSEKSSALEKGSRSLLPTQPAPSPAIRLVATYGHLSLPSPPPVSPSPQQDERPSPPDESWLPIVIGAVGLGAALIGLSLAGFFA